MGEEGGSAGGLAGQVGAVAKALLDQQGALGVDGVSTVPLALGPVAQALVP